MNGPATVSGLASTGIAVGRELDEAARVERQRAMRTLIQHPLLRADGPYAEEFGLVRRHFAWLRDWMARFPGWRLDAGSEFVRLRKIPASTWDGSRAA